MHSICIDSNFVIALANSKDHLHEQAVRFSHLFFSNESYISDLVFSELTTIISQQTDRETAIITGNMLLNSPFTKLVIVDHSLFLSSWQIFTKLKPKNLSFVDCSILAMIRHHKLKKLLSFDRTDFAPLQEQFGFKLIR